jgi:hypothetical protein
MTAEGWFMQLLDVCRNLTGTCCGRFVGEKQTGTAEGTINYQRSCKGLETREFLT